MTLPILIEFGNTLCAEGEVEDLTPGGVRLSSPSEVPMGAELSVTIPVGNRDRRLLGRVVRVTPAPKNDGIWRFRIAVAFDQDSLATARETLRATVVGSAIVNDRRGAVRHELIIPIRISIPGQAEPAFGMTRDMSSTGLAALTRNAFEAGLTTRVESAARELPFAREGTIVTSMRNPDDPHGLWPYRTPVRFDEEIADFDAVLAQLRGDS